jgi:hypothetical protein
MSRVVSRASFRGDVVSTKVELGNGDLAKSGEVGANSPAVRRLSSRYLT